MRAMEAERAAGANRAAPTFSLRLASFRRWRPAVPRKLWAAPRRDRARGSAERAVGAVTLARPSPARSDNNRVDRHLTGTATRTVDSVAGRRVAREALRKMLRLCRRPWRPRGAR